VSLALRRPGTYKVIARTQADARNLAGSSAPVTFSA
jgi:hypothetical protein